MLSGRLENLSNSLLNQPPIENCRNQNVIHDMEKSNVYQIVIPEIKEIIKEKTKATIRCIPLGDDKEQGNCIFSGNPSKQKVLFAKAY